MYLTIENLIGKIANDFNPPEDDWIPRVPQWVSDALSELGITSTETTVTDLVVINKVAHYPRKLIPLHFRVFDCDGCEVAEYDRAKCAACGRPTKFINDGYHYYVLGKNDTIELNFHTKSICVHNDDKVEMASDAFGCDTPAIPNVGSLFEGLSYYCMWKHLQRGGKHPTLNLSNTYVSNPYYHWHNNRDRIKTEVILAIQDEKTAKHGMPGGRSWFFNYTFNPRG